MKGIIYLIGLIGSTMLTILLGNGIVGKENNVKEALCDIVTINHIAGISNIPISIIIYCFTLAYFLFTIVSINITYLFSSLVPLISLGVLIVMDILWITTKNCFQTKHILVAIIISLLLGCLWGYIINNVNNKSLQYFNADDNVCTVPKRSYFKVSNIRNKK
tara:strand:- start:350 stop:835 length:486 start_codon:yes stop_codon:yes gene_type:complete